MMNSIPFLAEVENKNPMLLRNPLTFDVPGVLEWIISRLDKIIFYLLTLHIFDLDELFVY